MLTPRDAARFYSTFSGLVRRIVNRRLGRDSEVSDVVQEAFVQIFRSWDSLQNVAQIEPWVARIAAHTAYKELRRRRRRLRLLPSEVAESVLARSGYQTDLDGRELLRRAAWALDELSIEHGSLLWQRLFEQRTLEQMAEQAGWSQSMLKRRLQRARVRFERLAANDGLLKERLAL